MIKLKRYESNPILTPNNNLWENRHTFNAGAVVHNGRIYLLYRAEGEELRNGPGSYPVTRLGLAISENGYAISYRHPEPVLDRDLNDPWCEFGCEDPRISKIGDTYYIVYVSMSRFGYTGDRLAYATTRDFKSFQKHGLLMKQMEQRTSGLLPSKVDGKFVLFHRPMPNMWVSSSSDLETWEGMTCIFEIKEETWYENKLGIGAPPIETDYGWLLFWHGKNNKAKYALGIMLLDKNDPRRIVKVQEEPVLRAETDYETMAGNIVYTNGAVRFNDKYFVYYGHCDRYLSVATVGADEIDAWCRKN